MIIWLTLSCYSHVGKCALFLKDETDTFVIFQTSDLLPPSVLNQASTLLCNLHSFERALIHVNISHFTNRSIEKPCLDMSEERQVSVNTETLSDDKAAAFLSLLCPSTRPQW